MCEDCNSNVITSQEGLWGWFVFCCSFVIVNFNSYHCSTVEIRMEMADDKNEWTGVVKVKEEAKSDEESDDAEPMSSLELVRVMYESIKDISSTETKPNKGKYMESFKNFKKERDDYYSRTDMEPDRSKTDFYCKTCEAHMNSEEMWESHISGKRHLKNIQKYPGEMPSKVRAIKIKAPPKILEIIKDVDEPVIGLSYMTELQRADPFLKPSYTCHLCQANCTWSVVIDHILTTKHRLAYIRAVDPAQYEMIDSMGLKTTCLDQLAEERAHSYEEKGGCGDIEVKLEKPKMVEPPPSRSEVSVERSTRSRSLSSERTIARSPSRHRQRRSRSRSTHRPSPYKYKRYSRSSSEEGSPYCRASSSTRRKVDVDKLSSSDKIKLMQKLCQTIHPLSQSLAKEIPEIITNLTTEILRYKIRQLSLTTQNKLAKYIAKEETRKFYQQLLPHIEDVFDAIKKHPLGSGHH